MNLDKALQLLEDQADPAYLKKLAHFNIKNVQALGLRVPQIRAIAKQIKSNHSLALELWDTKIHEARLLACFIANPKLVDEAFMEHWVNDFNAWDICDQVCATIFVHSPLAYSKAMAWSKHEKEFIKRAGFVLMACLSIHDKKADDESIMQFFPALIEGASDERNFVKKAVNWAIRQIGKRNLNLHKQAIMLAEEIYLMDLPAAKWIANDALKELKNEKIMERIKRKVNK